MANAPKALGVLSLTPTAPYQKPKVKQDRAAWGVINDGFFDDNDKLWFPNQMLYFDGEPNQNLFPLNKLAHDKMQAFLDKLDVLGEQVAKNNKKTYVRQPRKEWKDGEEMELPQVENVMGMPRTGKNDEIR